MDALMLMCGGDGLADIAGRRLGKTKLPWNRDKSWAGTAAMFLGGWIFALVILGIYQHFGVLKGTLSAFLPAVTLIALVGTLVETLPLHDIDNITVTLSAVPLGHLVLYYC
jgi:phytol kinase